MIWGMAVSPGGRPADATPLGKKPGPRGLTDYVREVAHALMRKGVPEGKAIAIARSQQAKWAVKSKNPAIRAASVESLAAQHVLDHRKRGKRDMSRAFDTGNTDSLIDLDWASFDSARPAGGARPAAAAPVAQQRATAARPPDLFTAETHQKIRAFQQANGLPVTGNLDQKTVSFLNDPKNSVATHAAASTAANKTAKSANKAAKKAAAAKATADKKAHAAVTKKNAAKVKSDQQTIKNRASSQKAAAKASKGSLANGKPVQTVSMAVPAIGSTDGARMAGNVANFGGKRAAPFVKGGGRAKKAKLSKASTAKVEFAKRMAAARAAK